LGAALDYISDVGLEKISAHEQSLLDYATDQLRGMNTIRLIGTAREKASIVSFVMDGVHAHDVGTIVDRTGVAIRVGHHCAEPVMQRYGVAATARASFGLYNTHAEVDKLIEALQEVKELFG
jgi:cysteine desulfurase/selenocysteine lyase